MRNPTTAALPVIPRRAKALRRHIPPAVFAIVAAFGAGCSQPTPSQPANKKIEVTTVKSDDLKLQIDAFCGNCHVVPDPSAFPQSAWHEEVSRGFDFYFESGRNDLSPPPLAQVTDYFRDLAPKELVLPKPADSVDAPNPLRFRIQDVTTNASRSEPASISFIDWTNGPSSGSFWISDMEHGSVVQQSIEGKVAWNRSDLCANPAAVRICDLDQNAEPDLILADLGSFQPADHDRGRLIWLPNFSRADSKPITILEKVGRVADAHVGDFDGDHRPDLVVAEFGWHRTGGIHVLYNREDNSATPAVRFDRQTVDSRPGTIHVPTADLNGDGRLDFVALISQEYEVVVAFLNEPDGFRKVNLGESNDPAWGSSGLQLTDLDNDGDLDVLVTNGDSFDSHLIKPYHGISWLENKGHLEFQKHRLTAFPGVHRALAADFDRDGDLDIAAAAMLPRPLLQGRDASEFDSVIWLEQTAPGQFQRHSIQRGSVTHAAMTVGDFDGDSDIDIAVGQFGNDQVSSGTSMTILWNDGPASAVGQ